MTIDDDSPTYEVRINDDRAWHVGSEFSEYDATHAVVGALLAGAEKVEITRTDHAIDGGPAKTLADYREQFHRSEIVTLRIPEDPDEASELTATDPIFHGAVRIAARYGVGTPGELTQESLDAVVNGNAGYRIRIPVHLLTAGEPRSVAPEVDDHLRTVVEGEQ